MMWATSRAPNYPRSWHFAVEVSMIRALDHPHRAKISVFAPDTGLPEFMAAFAYSPDDPDFWLPPKRREEAEPLPNSRSKGVG